MAKNDEAELELLGNLFNFIKKKHSNLSISSIETKFGKSARELVDIGEISELSLVTFCDLEGIDVPKKKEKQSKSETSSSSSYGRTYSDPYGSGGGNRTSSGC
jgi:hypothetical protein